VTFRIRAREVIQPGHYQSSRAVTAWPEAILRAAGDLVNDYCSLETTA
jgi:hypothetical protein